MDEYKSDVLTVENILSALYESICFHEGEPNWSRLGTLFYEEARLIHVKGDEAEDMNINEFIRRFQEQIRKGKINSFHEFEIYRKVEAFHNIVQVFSTYEAKINPDDVELVGRGINCIQLIKLKNRWWVTSILWEAEKEEFQIPAEYLP